MAEEEIEYILKEQEYKDFQESKAQIKRLTEDLDKCRGDNAQKAQTIQQYQKQIAVKSEEVGFLQQLIEEIGQTRPSDRNGLIDIKSTINESVWEVVEEPEQALKKATEQEIQAERQKFFQKFEKYLVKVDEINTRLQSQEEMISQLNQSTVANNKLLIGKTYADLLKQLEKDCQTKFDTVEVLKATISESRRNREERERLELRLKQKEEEVLKYKENVQKLSPLVTHYYKKIGQLQAENKSLRSQLPQ